MSSTFLGIFPKCVQKCPLPKQGDLWQNQHLDDTVVLLSRRVRVGESFLFLMNFMDEEKRVWVNGKGWRDVILGEQVSGEVNVSARGVKVIRRDNGWRIDEIFQSNNFARKIQGSKQLT